MVIDFRICIVRLYFFVTFRSYISQRGGIVMCLERLILAIERSEIRNCIITLFHCAFY